MPSITALMTLTVAQIFGQERGKNEISINDGIKNQVRCLLSARTAEISELISSREISDTSAANLRNSSKACQASALEIAGSGNFFLSMENGKEFAIP